MVHCIQSEEQGVSHQMSAVILLSTACLSSVALQPVKGSDELARMKNYGTEGSPADKGRDNLLCTAAPARCRQSLPAP